MHNIVNMMGQMKEIQEKMEKMQTDIVALETEGVAGGDLVRVRLNGKNELLSLKIDPSLLNEKDTEILKDLIIAAHKDAKSKIESLMLEKTREATAGLPMPAGFKLPF